MKSATPKVLHSIGGRSLVGHALAAAPGLEPEQLAVVVGHGRDQVEPHVDELAPDAVHRRPGRAARHRRRRRESRWPSSARDLTGTVVVTYGDVPLLTTETLAALRRRPRRRSGNAVTVLTAEVPNPFGYGRIVRDASGAVDGHRRGEGRDRRAAGDPRDQLRHLRLRRRGARRCARRRSATDNAAGEVYLTDVVAIAHRRRPPGRRARRDDLWQTEGVNTRAQLARLGRELNAGCSSTGWPRASTSSTRPRPGSTSRSSWRRTSRLLPGTQLHGADRGRDRRRDRPGHDPHRRARSGAGARSCARTDRARFSAPAQRSGRSPTCAPAPSSARKGKIGTFVETKNADDRRRARRFRTSRTSVTPRSARAPTSAPARSSPTTTASTSTAPKVGVARAYRRQQHVRRAGRDRRRRHHRRRHRRTPRRRRPARSPSPADRSASIADWVLQPQAPGTMAAEAAARRRRPQRCRAPTADRAADGGADR